MQTKVAHHLRRLSTETIIAIANGFEYMANRPRGYDGLAGEFHPDADMWLTEARQELRKRPHVGWDDLNREWFLKSC